MTKTVNGCAKSLTTVGGLNRAYGFGLIQGRGWGQIEIQFKAVPVLFGKLRPYHEPGDAFDTDLLSDKGVRVVIEFKFDFEKATDVDVVEGCGFKSNTAN